MRAALPVALALAACSSADSAPAPKPPAKTGAISGTVSIVIRGPGRAHPPEENTSRTGHLDCEIAISDKLAVHTAKDSGRFDAEVPAGTYTLSFAKCAPPCCAGAPATREVTVTAGKTTTADWSCACAAK